MRTFFALTVDPWGPGRRLDGNAAAHRAARTPSRMINERRKNPATAGRTKV